MLTANTFALGLATISGWIQSLLLAASSMVAFVHSSFFSVVRILHTACTKVLGGAPAPTWNTVFRCTSDEIKVVIRVSDTFGFGYGNKKIQGAFKLQQSNCFGLTRLCINGDSITDDGQKGKGVWGAVYFPDDASIWTIEVKKVKSGNESSIRGRSILIGFNSPNGSTHPKDNMAGVLGIQITFIHSTSTGKQIGVEFERCINDLAAKNNKIVRNKSI